jgi:hypothetical protein
VTWLQTSHISKTYRGRRGLVLDDAQRKHHVSLNEESAKCRHSQVEVGWSASRRIGCASSLPMCRERKRERAMTSYRIRIVATVASMALSTPIFAQNAQMLRHPDYGFSRHTLLAPDHTKIGGHSWCLRDYSSDTNDCSFTDRAQCAGTAAGGLGECMIGSSAP